MSRGDFYSWPLKKQLDHIERCQKGGLEEIRAGSPACLADIADHLDLWGPWLLAKVRELAGLSVPPDELEAILSDAHLDFEQIYEGYPRKMGKTAGFKKCKQQIKSLTAWAELRIAVENFKRYHEEKGTDRDYLPYFSTFMSSWRDWINPEEDPTPPIAPRAKEKSNHWRSQAKRIADGEL